MAARFDAVEETIGLLEVGAAALDAAGRSAVAAGHRRWAAGLRDLADPRAQEDQAR